MATIEELKAALKAAHEAGNVDDAKRLADAIVSMRTQKPNVDKVQQQFQSLPWYGKMGQAADDVIRQIANGATLGYADKLAGNLPGGGSEETQRINTEEAQMRSGSAGTAANILGMLLPASRISEGVGAVTGLTGKTMGESAIREGIAGGITGGTLASSEAENPREVASGTMTGILGGSVGGAAGSKLGDLFNWAGKKLGITSPAIVDKVTPPRSVPELKKAVNSAYDKVDELGTRYSGKGYNKMVAKTADDLNKARIDPETHKNAVIALKKLQAEIDRGGDISPRNLDDLRRVINRDVGGSPGEDFMGGILRDNMDEFIKNGEVVAGSSDEASSALLNARDLNRRMRTLEDVDQALFKGENATSSRGDISQLRTMLNNPKRTAGMSKPELDAMKKVVRGDTVENFMRGTVGGLPVTPIGAGIITGAATGNPVAGLLAGGSAALAEPLAEKAARKYTDANIKKFIEAISGGETVDAAMRAFLPAFGQAVGVGVPAEDLQRERRRRKRMKR